MTVPYINSVQPVSIGLSATQTTNAQTINAVSSNAFILFNGLNSTDTTGVVNTVYSGLALPSSTSVSATRNSHGSIVNTVNGMVVDPTSNLVSAVQYGTVQIASGATSGSLTLTTAVSTNNSVIIFNGVVTPQGSSATFPTSYATLSLVNSTTVTAAVNTATVNTQNVNFCIVTFNSAVLNQNVQSFSLTSATSSAVDTQTIASVVPANTIVIYNGSAVSNNTFATDAVLCQLASATSVTLTRATAISPTRTHSFSVVEFVSGVVSVQRGVVSLSTSQTTNTATISSANQTTTALNYTGFNTTATGVITGKYFPLITPVSSTSLSATIPTSGFACNVGYEAITFIGQNGTITESGTAADTLSAGNTTSAAITESGSGSDTASASNSTSASISESGSASDTTGAIFFATASVSETGNASDLCNFVGANSVIETGNATDGTNASYQTSATVSETGSATDGVSAAYTTAAGVSEAGSATDTVSQTGGTTQGVSEAGNASDGTSSLAIFAATISETGSAADLPNASGMYGVGISETGNANDTASAGNHTICAIVENGSASDVVASIIRTVALISEAGTASDFTYIGNTTSITSESGNATDGTDAVQSTPTPYIIGSQTDMLNRLLSNLPARWFPASSIATPPSVASPILAGLLAGPASAFSWVYSQIQYTRQQLRISTATGFMLDIISLDFFGMNLPRRLGETDTAFRIRIKQNLFIPKGTRASIVNAVTTLTGLAPTVFEPTNATDTGGYGSLKHPNQWNGLAYNYAGGYGTLNYPNQFFVIAQRAVGVATPQANVNGYGGYLSGYASLTVAGNYGSGCYINGTIQTGQVTDAEIYQTIADNSVGGTIAWAALTD